MYVYIFSSKIRYFLYGLNFLIQRYQISMKLIFADLHRIFLALADQRIFFEALISLIMQEVHQMFL